MLTWAHEGQFEDRVERGGAPSHIYITGISPILVYHSIQTLTYSEINEQQFGVTTKLIKEDNPDGFSFPHELVQL